jgi:hypothetical protein
VTAPLIHVHESALPPELFGRLRRAVVALGTRGLAETYRTTFWFDLEDAPRAVTEEAAQVIAAHLPRRRGVRGVEWWLSRMRTTDVQVDFHRDRDDRLAQAGGPEVHPLWSTVLFLNRCRGGLLAVTAQAPDDAMPARAPLPLDADLVRPWPGRLVVFRGDRTHGVLDARNRIPQGRLPGRPPLRLALIANFWDHRPTGVPEFTPRGIHRGLGARPPGSQGRG